MKARMKRHAFYFPVFCILLACRSAAPPASTAPSTPVRRVVLLSLDGASSLTLHRLYEEGALITGGFSRFFREGQVADGLIPVDPSLTAVNHISLATGYTPDKTGIVANNFHPAGTPFLETVSGFTAPIHTETLWEAVRRQGKHAGVVNWPGADGNGSRRTADWGMTYVNDPERRAELVTVGSGLWEPAEETARTLGLQNRSPVQGIAVQVGAGEPEAQQFDLLAADGRLLAVPPGSRQAFPLPLGQWADLPCRLPSRDAVCPIKLLTFDPAAETTLYFGGVYPLPAYPEDFASALAARKLFWTGPPDDHFLGAASMNRPGIDLETWLEQSDRFTRFFGESLLTAARRSDWDLLMGYFPVIDEAGHALLLADPRQPGFTPERRDALEAARRRVWQAVDRELARLLAELDLRSTVVVIVSDHGMTPVHTALDPNDLLKGKGLLAMDRKGKILEKGTVAWTVGSGGAVHVYVAPDRPDLMPVLRDLFANWTVNGEHPVERVYTRREAAAVHLDHPDSGDLVLFLREGYGDGEPGTYGKHGYLTTYPDMHGIYLVLGAGIPPGNPGTVRNPEVAGRVASWLGIGKPRPTP